MSELIHARTLALDTGEAALLPAMVKTVSRGAALSAARGAMHTASPQRLSSFVDAQNGGGAGTANAIMRIDEPSDARKGSVAGRAVLRQVRWRG